MSEYGMLTKSITDSDEFVSLPKSTQLLYFHLLMHCDENDYVYNPVELQKRIGANDEDVRTLLLKNYIIYSDNGYVVIKNPHIHYYIYLYKSKEYEQIEQNFIPYLKTLNENPPKMSQEQVNKDMEFLKAFSDEPKKETKQKSDDGFVPRSELQKVLQERGIEGELKNALTDFVYMRIKKKRPLTPRALNMVINKLDKIANNDYERKIALVDSAIEHGWDTVWETDSVGKNGVKLAKNKDHTLDDVF